MRSQNWLLAVLALLAGVAGRTQPANAADPAPPAGAKLAPAAVWPATLERISGRYVFVQVASPGGLWRSNGNESRQVSLYELSPAARGRLEQAEIVISDLKLPTTVSASEELSPSKRGHLRHYEESGMGRLVMKNLPGIGGLTEDSGAYSGPVSFQLNHASHSNPSVSGILTLRRQQEVTWGVATIDYADIMATPLVPAGKADEEVLPVISNARLLRSGFEIFAYVNWTEKGPNGAEVLFRGSVRLERRVEPPGGRPAPQAAPGTSAA